MVGYTETSGGCQKPREWRQRHGGRGQERQADQEQLGRGEDVSRNGKPGSWSCGQRRATEARDDRDEGAVSRWRWGQRRRQPTRGGEVVLGLELVTKSEEGPSWGNSEDKECGAEGPKQGGCRGVVGEGGIVSAQDCPPPRDLCMEAHTWWGSPPPCPPLGDPLLGPRGGLCGR